MTKIFAREQIAAELSELRNIRFSIADLQGIGWSLMARAKETGVADDLTHDLKTAMGLIDRMDKVASARMVSLYDMPTPAVANVNVQEEAA